jgi:hypothetical protein
MKGLEIVAGYAILIEGKNHDPFMARGKMGLPFFAMKRADAMAQRRCLVEHGIPMKRTTILKVEVHYLEAGLAHTLSE